MIAGIIGYTGYTGTELLKLLSRHSYIDRINLFSNSVSGESKFRKELLLKNKKKYHFYSRTARQINECEILFFCTPEGYCLENISKYFDGKKNNY